MSIDPTYYAVSTTELSSSGVTAEVSLFIPEGTAAVNGLVCFTGTAQGLEPGLEAIGEKGGLGEDCASTNGCGVHIHDGTGCADATEQGGHWWNDDLSPDPWLITSYKATTPSADGYDGGEAIFSECVPTGFDLAGDLENDIDPLDGKTFVVHDKNGSRVSCGVIKKGKAKGKPKVPKKLRRY